MARGDEVRARQVDVLGHEAESDLLAEQAEQAASATGALALVDEALQIELQRRGRGVPLELDRRRLGDAARAQDGLLPGPHLRPIGLGDPEDVVEDAGRHRARVVAHGVHVAGGRDRAERSAHPLRDERGCPLELGAERRPHQLAQPGVARRIGLEDPGQVVRSRRMLEEGLRLVEDRLAVGVQEEPQVRTHRDDRSVLAQSGVPRVGVLEERRGQRVELRRIEDRRGGGARRAAATGRRRPELRDDPLRHLGRELQVLQAVGAAGVGIERSRGLADRRGRVVLVEIERADRRDAAGPQVRGRGLHGPAAEGRGDLRDLLVVGVLAAGHRLPGADPGVAQRRERRLGHEPRPRGDGAVDPRQRVDRQREERLALPRHRRGAGRGGAADAVAATAGDGQLARPARVPAHRREVRQQLVAQRALADLARRSATRS